jgi:hypothetical protein
MNNFKTVIKIFISLGLGIGLIIWFWDSMSATDKAETINAFKRANYFWVILAPINWFYRKLYSHTTLAINASSIRL